MQKQRLAVWRIPGWQQKVLCHSCGHGHMRARRSSQAHPSPSFRVRTDRSSGSLRRLCLLTIVCCELIDWPCPGKDQHTASSDRRRSAFFRYRLMTPQRSSGMFCADISYCWASGDPVPLGQKLCWPAYVRSPWREAAGGTGGANAATPSFSERLFSASYCSRESGRSRGNDVIRSSGSTSYLTYR